MQNTDKPTAESAVDLDETALDGVIGGSTGASIKKISQPAVPSVVRKAGGGQPDVASDPETGGERA